MNNRTKTLSRRQFMRGFGLLSAGIVLMPKNIFGESRQSLTSAIPSTGERIPVIGMGTSRTFDAGNDPAARAQLRQVLQVFSTTAGRSLILRRCTVVPRRWSVIC